MNQNTKRIAEGELAKYIKQYLKWKDKGEKDEEEYDEMLIAKKEIKDILFDLWENGDITIAFN